MFNDLMDNIEWFFNIHDKNKDGYLTKDEVLTLSESLLVCLSLSHRCFYLLTCLTPSSSSGLKSVMPIWGQ
jgi:EF-hand domain